eukprot:1446942-Rhodomonas_salina.1
MTSVGLIALGDCISALSEASRHIPYRNSKLTRLLQGDTGNRGRDVGNRGRDVGNRERDVGNRGRDVGNRGRDVGGACAGLAGQGHHHCVQPPRLAVGVRLRRDHRHPQARGLHDRPCARYALEDVLCHADTHCAQAMALLWANMIT